MRGQSEAKPRWTLIVDLTGGNFPGARSVLVAGDWDATPDRIRTMAATYYDVPLSQVKRPVERNP